MPTHAPNHGLSQSKAKKILEHGEVHGKKLTKKQRGFMGARAGGKKKRRTGGAGGFKGN